MTDIKQLLSKAEAAQAQGDLSSALSLFQQALQQDLNNIDLLIHCGNLSMQLERFEEGAGFFRRLLMLNKNPDVRNALCYALQAMGNQAHRNGKYPLAAACFEEALTHQPNNAVFWYNLGNAQRESNDLEVALTSFEKALAIEPNDADAHNNLGNIHGRRGNLNAAITHYKQALAINPKLYHALVHLVHQKQHTCDWNSEDGDITDQIATIREWVQHVPEAKVTPFAFIGMPSTTAEEQKLCASRYIMQHYADFIAQQDSLGFIYNTKKEKIKVGYLSADFRLHPLAFLITDLIEQLDRDQFEVVAYSYGATDETSERKRLVAAFDRFNDIRHLNDIEAAKKINVDGVDILVDLTGFTQSSRTGIIALKPAAIHINWLGYPGTMGEYTREDHQTQPLFDYIIADNIIAPNTNDFSEKIIYLPCYQPNNKRDINAKSTRADHHLPKDAFVFCSFNQTFKIDQKMFSIWMRLLNKTPNSVLWLLDCNVWAKENLIQAATSQGVAADRLIFAARVDNKTHMQRQQHADLFLDTLPYNAHTTASDALAAGLPILTCTGDTFASKVAASLLSQVDCDELICHTLDDYEIKALDLANNPDILAPIQKKLQKAVQTHDLFKPQKFAQRLEAEYQNIWETYCMNAGKSA